MINYEMKNRNIRTLENRITNIIRQDRNPSEIICLTSCVIVTVCFFMWVCYHPDDKGLYIISLVVALYSIEQIIILCLA